MRISDISQLKFSNGGLFTSEGVWQHPHRRIDSCELILVTAGKVCLQEGDRRHTLRPGDYILLHPHILHFGWQPTEEKTAFYWLHFYGENIPDAPISGSLSNPGILVQCARQLLQIHQSPAYPPGTCEAMLRVLLAELYVQREQTTAPSALASQTCEYIRSHADQPLAAVQVADAMGYSADHLSRILRKEYGRTLCREITFHRLNRAKLLLQTTNMTIAQLALHLGWKDPNLFEKFFVYHQKCTPTAYRQSFSRTHTNHK